MARPMSTQRIEGILAGYESSVINADKVKSLLGLELDETPPFDVDTLSLARAIEHELRTRGKEREPLMKARELMGKDENYLSQTESTLAQE